MYIMCVCLFSALNRRAGALQISIIIIMGKNIHKTSELVGEDMVWCVCVFHVCVVADRFIRHYSLLSSRLTALLSHVILNE